MKNTLIIVLVFLSALLPFTSKAQNNVFKINDKLFEYYQKCKDAVHYRKVLSMADTLFLRSGRMHDTKAQCLALYLKGSYYYQANDIPHFNKIRNTMYNFASKTPHTQYIFGLWNLYINYFISKKQYKIAIEELKNYQQKAFELKSKYGIGFSYVKLGDLYYMQGQNEISLQEYSKALEHFMKNGPKNEVAHVYNSMALAYYSDANFKEAEKYCLKNIPDDYDDYKGMSYILLTIMKLNENNPQYEYYYQKYLEWKKTHVNVNKNDYYLNLMKIYYYQKKKDYVQALAYCDSLLDPTRIESHKSAVYADMKDYQKAYEHYKTFMQFVNEQNKKELKGTMAEYSALFENERYEKLSLEKNKLQLKNSTMLLNQLRAQQQFLLVDKERNHLALTNTKLELNLKNLTVRNQRIEMVKQRAELEKQRAEVQRQHDKAKSLEIISKKNKHISLLLTIGLLTFVIYTLIYMASHRKSEKRLKKEMKETELAMNKAEAARVEAERANQVKTMFLQNMSHEIRTPLNAIVGFSNLMIDSDDELDKKTKTEFSNLIVSNSMQLTNIIDDILDLSQLETGNYKMKFDWPSLNELCSQTVASVKGKESDDVILQFIAPSEDFKLYTDPGRTRQLLTNFLTNACKYTEKGSITLTYEKQENNIVFSVTDTGQGINSEDADKIFERFEKLDQFKKGTGLGLNICSQIAKLLHGEVKLDTSYHNGSRFLFIHPITAES